MFISQFKENIYTQTEVGGVNKPCILIICHRLSLKFECIIFLLINHFLKPHNSNLIQRAIIKSQSPSIDNIKGRILYHPSNIFILTPILFQNSLNIIFLLMRILKVSFKVTNRNSVVSNKGNIFIASRERLSIYALYFPLFVTIRQDLKDRGVLSS